MDSIASLTDLQILTYGPMLGLVLGIFLVLTLERAFPVCPQRYLKRRAHISAARNERFWLECRARHQ